MRRITTHRTVLGGKPVIEGTRMSVDQVLGMLAKGMTPARIVESHPILTESDVRAAVACAKAALQKHVAPDVAFVGTPQID